VRVEATPWELVTSSFPEISSSSGSLRWGFPKKGVRPFVGLALAGKDIVFRFTIEYIVA
jgi:hypothetical protein